MGIVGVVLIAQLNIFNRRSLPSIIQSEASECGLACLAMVSSYHGAQWDIRSLRANYPVSLKGITLDELSRVAELIGFNVRAVRLELNELSQLSTPCILHWDLNHFVVLKAVSKHQVVIHDPAFGERKLSFAQISPHFTGVAAELSKAKKFTKPTLIDSVRIRDLWEQISGFIPSLLQIFALSVLLQLFALASPFLNQLVVDEAITKSDSNLLSVLALGFVFLLVIEIGVGVIRSLISIYVGNTLSYQMQTNLARHLFRLPVEYFEKRHIGDVTSRFSSLVPIQGFMTSGLVGVVLDGLLAVSTVVLMYVYSPVLSAVTFLGLFLYLVVRLVTYPWIRRMTMEHIASEAKLDTTFLENIRGVRAIRIFGKEPQRLSIWQVALTDAMNLSIKVDRFGIHVGVWNQLVAGLSSIAILYLSATMVIEGEFTLGMMFAFQSYRGQFVGRATALIDAYLGWKMLGIHLERLADIVQTEKEPEGQESRFSLAGNISLQNLSYRYAESEPFVIKDVSLEVDAGELVVISGASGMGKSTLLKLMLGLLPQASGQIAYDDKPLSQFSKSLFRQQTGVVMQDDQLLSGSIRENISFFDNSPDEEQIIRTARYAGIHKEIEQMPMGYESLIGDMGSSLSGGQKQRILLARALYHKPKILFLDEGTANLDTTTELDLVDKIKEMPLTRIVIAHRPAFIRVSDQHYQLTKEGLIPVS